MSNTKIALGQAHTVNGKRATCSRCKKKALTYLAKTGQIKCRDCIKKTRDAIDFE